MYVCTDAHVCSSAWGGQRHHILVGLELAVVNCLVWVLEKKIGSTTRAVCALNYWPITPTPLTIFEDWVIFPEYTTAKTDIPSFSFSGLRGLHDDLILAFFLKMCSLSHDAQGSRVFTTRLILLELKIPFATRKTHFPVGFAGTSG